MNYCLSTAHSTRYHNLSPEINYFTELSRTLAYCKNRYTNCSRGQNLRKALQRFENKFLLAFIHVLHVAFQWCSVFTEW